MVGHTSWNLQALSRLLWCCFWFSLAQIDIFSCLLHKISEYLSLSTYFLYDVWLSAEKLLIVSHFSIVILSILSSTVSARLHSLLDMDAVQEIVMGDNVIISSLAIVEASAIMAAVVSNLGIHVIQVPYQYFILIWSSVLWNIKSVIKLCRNYTLHLQKISFILKIKCLGFFFLHNCVDGKGFYHFTFKCCFQTMSLQGSKLCQQKKLNDLPTDRHFQTDALHVALLSQV